MPNPAFIVEGHMEQKFMQEVCPGQPVRRLGCNGDQVRAEAIAKHLKLHMAFLKKNYPVVVVFDREKRDISCEDFKVELINQLHLLDVCTTHLVIGIADRTIENWILADSDLIREEFGEDSPLEGYEGSFGKNKLKRLMPDGHYGETTDGLRLLKKICPKRVAGNSISFSIFIEKVGLDCWWTEPLLD